ncbi:lipoprotein [Yersinia nurmii]|uniref:Lipoprotein n=1 Tax=Yersinia nurmii TaxID=685706 RepID=A0ABP1YK08_9GAMM|nr:lipoprotein [Yersinia nurmii]
MKMPSIPKMPKMPSFLRLLKPIIPRFKSSIPILLGLLWCIALVVIWLWGPQWQMGEQHPLESQLSRWLVTAVLVLVAVCWLTWRVTRRLQELEKLQLDQQQREDDPVQIDLDRQNGYLSRWLQQLQRYLNTPRYLYQLPWYLMLGTEQSGKTTLLREGYKLTEIYSPDASKGDDAAQLQVRCWAGEKAVVVDPTGKLIEQPEQGAEGKPQLYSRLWQELLGWLQHNRKRQPLNGIIVTVDVYQLLTANKDRRESYIDHMRQRLHDVQMTLHSQIPVYLVLTKLDLLYGFEAMYQSLDKTQREAILGVTFTLNTQDEDHWRSELNQFWQQWMAQLNHAMPEMMFNGVDSDQRPQLFSFTRQIHGLHDYVLQMLDRMLFSGDSTPALLRGVYLTSAQQRGQMDDLFTQSAAVQYHLGPQAFPTWPVGDTSSYFAKGLFNQVLLAEPNLAGESRQWLRNSRRRMMAFSGCGAVAIVGLLFGWHQYYQSNYRAGQEVLTQAKTFLEIPPPQGEDQYGNLQLPLLDPIRQATLAYGNYHERNSLLADLGLYQGSKIGPYVENTYLQLLEQRFLPSLMSGLLVQLKAAPAGSEQKLEILRVMRMLEDGSGRNKGLVEQYMRNRWSEKFNGQRNLQNQLMDHLDYALEHTDWKRSRDSGDVQSIQNFAPYVPAVKAAQQELSKLSLYQRVYQNLRIKGQDALPPALNLRDQIGASFDGIFVANNEDLLMVPQFLTRQGLQSYFVKQNDQLIDLTSMDSWVLSLSKNVEYSDTDRKEIQRQITEQYLGDYTAAWRAAINNLEIRQFDDLPQAIAAIEQVISGEQPIRRALQTLSNNTQLPAASGDGHAKDLLEQPDYRLMSRINREFAPETAALIEHGDKGSTLQSVYQKLTDLHRYMLAIQNSPVPGKAALKAVQLRLDQNNSDPIFEVQQLAKNLPEPLNRWVGDLAEQAWHVVMMEAIQSLEVEWNDTVVKQYRTYLAGRYPFNPESTQDVPLSEFERFFAPKGVLDNFYQQNLKPFVENNLTNGSDGELLIRDDVLQQLQVAQKIRETFFSSQNGLGAQFAIEPVELAANKRRSVLNLDGQLLDYAHGRSNMVHLVWPNSMRSGVESKITLVPDASGKSPRSIAYSGPWAQLRLINAGELTNVREDSFDVRFNVDGGHMTYRITVDESDNPFAGGLFSQFKLPDTLY